MKKLLLLAMVAISSVMVHAQDVKKVQTTYLLKKTEDAKTEVDKVMADPKQNTKAEAFYWKSKVYAAGGMGAAYTISKLQLLVVVALDGAEIG